MVFGVTEILAASSVIPYKGAGGKEALFRVEPQPLTLEPPSGARSC